MNYSLLNTSTPGKCITCVTALNIVSQILLHLTDVKTKA